MTDVKASMDTIERLISQLRFEQAKIDAAILIIERLGAVARGTSGQKRRGRPPKWLAEAKSSVDAKTLEEEVMEYLRSPPSQAASDRNVSSTAPKVSRAGS